MNGTIKKIIAEKNFGFISVAEGEKEIFFHKSSCQGVAFEELHEGDAVTFEVEQSEKGPRAANVSKA